jgi:hypothetical protein
VSAASGNGFGFFYDTSDNTNFHTVTVAGGTSTVNTVTTPGSNAWERYEMAVTPTSVVFKINGSTVASHTTNLPTGVILNPYALVVTRTTATRSLDHDLFWLKSISTLSR